MYLNNRGLANHFLKNFDAAIADFNEAIKLEDSDPTIFYNRGNAYLNIGTEESIELAYQDFDTASTISPYIHKFWHAKGLAKQSKANCIEDRLKREHKELLQKLRNEKKRQTQRNRKSKSRGRDHSIGSVGSEDAEESKFVPEPWETKAKKANSQILDDAIQHFM